MNTQEVKAVQLGVLQTGPYTVRQLSLDSVPDHILAEWKRCNVRYENDLLHCDPEWLFVQFRGRERTIQVFLLERSGELVGAVPFELHNRGMQLSFGGIPLVRLPLRRLRLLGYSFSIPADEGAHDALMAGLVQPGLNFDAVFLEYVKVDSFLWNYLGTSPLVQRHFLRHCRRGPLPHPLVRFAGTFDDYLKSFSAKARKNRLREIRKLREQFQVELVRIRKPEEVDAFVDCAAHISRQSWQFQVLGWGLAALDTAVWKGRLKFAAERGWLRSYLLRCNGVGCAYIVGIQHRRRFYYAVIGFDQAWAEHSVGTVLQLLALEDLFNEDPPEIYDFATYAEYKARLATESYPEESIFLFRRRFYPALARFLDRTCCAGSTQAKALAYRLGLGPFARRLARRVGKGRAG